MKKTLLLLAVVLMGLSVMAQTNTYTKISSASELSAGDKVLLVGIRDDGSALGMGYQKSNNRHALEITESGGSITTSVATDPSSQTEPYEITIGLEGSAFTFYDEVKGGYLYAAGGGNYLKTQSTLDDKGKWTLSMDGAGFVPTSTGGVEQNIMRYNNTSTLFGCYKPSSTIAGLVYIFKASGSATPDPEPSNYPTNFQASLDITKVTLTWTASTGAQLPRGYVVIGSTGSITVPTDGNPVENDIDPADGHVAYNATDNDVYFEQLTPHTTWHFAIFPYTNSGANIDYKTDGTYPTASITTQNVECIFSSDFAAGLAPFMAYNVEGEQEWGTGTYNNIPYAKMTGYASQVNHANEDWLITPNLINGGAYSTLTIAFMNAYKFDGNALQCLYSTDYDGMSDPNEFNWTNITANFDWSTGEYVWANTNYTMNTSGMNVLYIAFKYTSTDTAASTWEVAEFKIYTGYDAVEENEAVKFNLYPNPANSIVKIDAEAAAEAQVIDMTGRVVMSVNVNAGENTVNVAELANGVYFVKINSSVVKFIKK
ncbi:MAG: T9SS type A sorting domain-containing protein [Bacteroidales bacterium]|nr:T9SS type A sorting domain-containing protein [Bacteroidales bacterium]